MKYKHILISILLLITTNTSLSQTITFLSVPLSGNINTFTQNLAFKGITVNKEISSKLVDGIRAFDVTIFPYTCLASVEYNTSTKNVYEAVLMFHISATLSEFTQFADNWSKQIYEKYSKGIYTLNYEQDEYRSYPADHYIVYSTKNNRKIGEIYLYMDINEYSKTTDKGVFKFQIMYRNSEAPSFEQQMQEYY